MNNPYLTKEKKYFLHTFNRQPLLIKRAKNSRVWDERGKSYLDFYSGLAVCSVGHNQNQVVKSIHTQSSQLIHSSNFFYTKPQFLLAQALTSKIKNTRVFFSNSGAEANELAFKLARLWAFKNKKSGRDIISFKGGFHGRTLATTAASHWHAKSNSYFDPLPTGFRSVPFNSLDQAKKAINKNTIAFILEPVQGEGGIRVAEKLFFKGLYQLCKKKNLLLIVDEIQSGMGRTGTLFAYEQFDVKPDIVTLAKGLAGGLPLGATLANVAVAKHIQPGLHGSTFGGNPVSCAAALEVLKLLTSKTLHHNKIAGQRLWEELNRLTRFPSVKEVRGLGLMLGIELRTNGAPYVSLARDRGLLINCTQGTVLRFLPPYFMKEEEMAEALAIIESVFFTLNSRSAV